MRLIGIVAITMGIAACAARPEEPQIVGVASVIDGATMQIHGETIRLSGVDIPEQGRMCLGDVSAHQRASQALSDFVEAQTVACAISARDRSNAHIGQCRVAGADVGEHMIEQGWARAWPADGVYAAADARAGIDHRGFWAMNCPGLWGSHDSLPR